MAFAKVALNQLFSWCPLGQQRHLDATEQRSQDDTREDLVASSLPDARPRIPDTVVHRTMAPDLRQCEPWRQAALLDATTRNDDEQHKRLAR